MITNYQKRLITSLDKSKYRKSEGLFKAEGTKCVLDTINHFKVSMVVATEPWLDRYWERLPAPCNTITAKVGELASLTNLVSRPEVIALYEIPQYEPDFDAMRNQLVIALDTVQDPGNFGTIVRLADWFGITNILCSKHTVDIFNPKAVMATMGAISRVRAHYVDLEEVLTYLKPTTPLFGTFLGGDNIFETKLPQNGVVVFGNEGNGIRKEIADLIDNRLTIPSYPAGQNTSESLNVAMAASITIAQFRHG